MGQLMFPAIPADFDAQFLVAPGPLPPDPLAGGPHAGQEVSLASLGMRVYPKSPVIHVRDATGTHLGVLLGRPVDMKAGRLLRDEVTLAGRLGDARDADRFVEEQIYALSGSFLFVLDVAGVRRLYLDACGSRSAVFDRQAGLAGATAPLLLGPEATAERFDRELYEALDIRHEGWFPAGLTAHRGVERVLVNHYLDLDSWTQHRHWPTAPIAPAADPQTACARVLDATRRTVEALGAAEPLAVALTAGNETRVILAACRSLAPGLEFVTARGAAAAGLDLDRARELAERFGLRHSVLPHRRADAEEAADWHRRAGLCIGGPNMWNHPTVSPLAGRTFIAGFGGEIGRAFFWRRSDTAATAIDADRLLPRFGMPFHPRVRDAVAAWMPGVERFDAFLKLDLAYMELRMGCWAYAQSYVMPDIPEVSPMISRESFSAMLSLDPQARRGNAVTLTSIRMAWPELLALPINRYGDYRDQLHLARRVWDHKHVRKKLRKLFG
jgi:hypothetical protein